MSEPTTIITSPPAVLPDPEPQTGLTSKHAMWVGTMVPVAHLGLAIADVGSAKELWIGAWWATFAIASLIIGVKPAKDIFITAMSRPRVVP